MQDEQQTATQPPEDTDTGLSQEEQDEWKSATDEYAKSNDHKVEELEEDDELAKKTEEDEEKSPPKNSDDKDTETDKKKPEEKQDKTPEATHPESDKPKEEGELKEDSPQETPPTDPIRDSRSVQRQIIADERAVKSDIREKMFSDTPTELQDADGDPIRTIQDVMNLVNPNTKKNFTEEEAALYLMQAQQDLDRRLSGIDKQIDEIAETNLTLKDEADIIRERYGALFKAMPDVQKQVWQAYEQTLEKDPKTGIITKAPVSMEGFYNTSLAGYMKLAERLRDEEESKKTETEEKDKKTEEAKQKAKVEQKKSQEDREDIVSGGKSDTRTPEDKEWDSVAKEYYND